MASLFLQEQARLREAEGDEGFKAKVKLIKKHNSVDYNAFIIVACFGGSFLGIYLHDFGILQAITFGSLSILLFTPLDHWVHNKLFEKSKLKDQATN